MKYQKVIPVIDFFLGFGEACRLISINGDPEIERAGLITEYFTEKFGKIIG
ncbi:hypothetical protein [uncultured Thalassospira sp.]|uniref:hypothetical protein n=1 Tax=uncultured Thalassospira sp. TaxID=404382 RepID=UPI0030D9D787|tara:strand:- start:139 stop:291 length:153 start_codon:yes stop_codon:yes gene_type:complete